MVGDHIQSSAGEKSSSAIPWFEKHLATSLGFVVALRAVSAWHPAGGPASLADPHPQLLCCCAF